MFNSFCIVEVSVHSTVEQMWMLFWNLTMNRKKFFLYLSFCLYIKLCTAMHAAKHKQQNDKKNDNPGFYGVGDKVIPLSKSNFKEIIFDQEWVPLS